MRRAHSSLKVNDIENPPELLQVRGDPWQCMLKPDPQREDHVASSKVVGECSSLEPGQDGV